MSPGTIVFFLKRPVTMSLIFSSRGLKNIIHCEKVQNANKLHDRTVSTAEYITNEMLAKS